MLNTTEILIDAFVESLLKGYRRLQPGSGESDCEFIAAAARNSMQWIASSNALYHNFEHTMLVTSVGMDILQGRQEAQADVRREDGLNIILALLCHDIGYVRGICKDDEPDRSASGMGDGQVSLQVGISDAGLMPYHIDRGKLYVQENYAGHPLIDLALVHACIERTRFPIPDDPTSRLSGDYPGLVRAADLIGQLSDPRYLAKLPAIFYEFEETCFNQVTGYDNPGDLMRTYPEFFRCCVLPYLDEALEYLECTAAGREVIARLFANVRLAEQAAAQQPQRQIRAVQSSVR